MILGTAGSGVLSRSVFLVTTTPAGDADQFGERYQHPGLAPAHVGQVDAAQPLTWVVKETAIIQHFLESTTHAASALPKAANMSAL